MRLFFNGWRIPFTPEPGEPWRATFSLERRLFHGDGERRFVPPSPV